MLYRCVAAIPNGSGRCLEWFYEDTPKGRAEAEAFARKHDKPGMGVYDCVSLLREKRRSRGVAARGAGAAGGDAGDFPRREVTSSGRALRLPLSISVTE